MRLVRGICYAVIAVIVIIVGVIYVKKYMPTGEHVSLSECYPPLTEDGVAVILNGAYRENVDGSQASRAITSDGVCYIERTFLKDELDNRYYFDDNEGILRYITDQSVVNANYGSSSYTVGGVAKNLDAPAVITAHDSVYVSMPFIETLTDVTWKMHGSGKKANPRRIVIFKAGYSCQKANFRRDTAVRETGGPKGRIKVNAKGDDPVFIIKEYDRWTSVLTKNGVTGYVRSNTYEDVKKYTTKAKLPERNYQHNLMGQNVRLGWHQVTNKSANASLVSMITGTGLNVVSPTWFHLSDNVGGVSSIASKDYVAKAHKAGVKVWGLVSNFENRNVNVETVLSSTSTRDKLIKNILYLAKVCGMDGINVDFEEIPKSAADSYIEFIRELSVRARVEGYVVSVDNYVPENYNSYYDIGEQSKYADYIVIMGYDEYYAGSETAGPTASYPYVERGVKRTLKSVPAEQVVLAMPFYSRLWTVAADGSVSSRALTINGMESYVAKNNLTKKWLEDMGCHYVEGTVGGENIKMWMEDADSLKLKLELKKKSKLGGSAFWKLGMEPGSIWSVIAAYEN